jgi:hypothetical protein
LEEIVKKRVDSSLCSWGKNAIMKIITESIDYQKEMENTAETLPNEET